MKEKRGREQTRVWRRLTDVSAVTQIYNHVSSAHRCVSPRPRAKRTTAMTSVLRERRTGQSSSRNQPQMYTAQRTSYVFRINIADIWYTDQLQIRKHNFSLLRTQSWTCVGIECCLSSVVGNTVGYACGKLLLIIFSCCGRPRRAVFEHGVVSGCESIFRFTYLLMLLQWIPLG